MQYQGVCHKMQTTVGDTCETEAGELAASVEYTLILKPFECNLMPLLGKNIHIAWQGDIVCIECGDSTPKSYSQGYCYRCCMRLAACDMCMMKPETCHYHLGTCREPDWAQSFCFKPHVLYLANSVVSR